MADRFPRPIVLVPGWADTARSPWWDRIRHYLRDYDEDVEVMSVDFSKKIDAELLDRHEDITVPLTSIGSVVDYADRLCVRLEELDAGQADVIAHSFGGLVARYCVEKLGCDAVANLVTLGTPHQGSYTAFMAAFSEGGRQMLPGSEFLAELNKGPLNGSVRYRSVWSEKDTTIVQPWRASLPEELVEAHEDAVNMEVVGFTHFGLLWSRHVMEEYIDVFREEPLL